MYQIETIDIWENIHKIMIEWIESVVIEGWNIWRGKNKLEEIAENLTKKIMKSLIQDVGVPEFKIQRLLDLFYPEIYTWIDNILLIKADFYRDSQKLNRFSLSITSDLVRLFLDEEDYVEFI